MSCDFLGGTPHPDSAPYQVLGAMELANVRLNVFNLSRDNVSMSHVTLWVRLPHPKSLH